MRYLVLDTRMIESSDNAKLVVSLAEKDPNNPLFGEDKPWERRFDNLYPNVIFDRQEQIYKCWYSPFIVDHSAKQMSLEERWGRKYDPPRGREMGVCYATSTDGIVWDKPPLGLVEYGGSRENNLVYRGPHGAGILKDFRERDAAKRYKMLATTEELEMTVSFSPDGIHWGSLSPCPRINPYPVDGTHYNVLWLEETGEYVGFTRMRNKRKGGTKEVTELLGAWPPRQVGRTVSEDFLDWLQAEPILEGIDDNLQIYSMPVFRHGGLFLGLPVIHNQSTDRTWTELAWSADTVTWHRVCPGSPLISNSEEVGSYDWGCAYSSAGPVFLENEIRLYYGSSNGLHFGWRDGFFCLARLRPDGFAGYEQDSARKPAVITTVPAACRGGELRLSADVQSVGSVEVRLLDESDDRIIAQSKPVEETVTDGIVNWENGFSPASIGDRVVRKEFTIWGARLYSFATGDGS